MYTGKRTYHCCVPAESSSISIIWFNDTSITGLEILAAGRLDFDNGF
jgi:hypothetical protein